MGTVLGGAGRGKAYLQWIKVGQRSERKRNVMCMWKGVANTLPGKVVCFRDFSVPPVCHGHGHGVVRGLVLSPWVHSWAPSRGSQSSPRSGLSLPELRAPRGQWQVPITAQVASPFPRIKQKRRNTQHSLQSQRTEPAWALSGPQPAVVTGTMLPGERAERTPSCRGAQSSGRPWGASHSTRSHLGF